MTAIKKEVLDVEQWFDPQCDGQYLRIRKITEDGRRLGIIIDVRDSALFEVAEGMQYPRVQLPKQREIR